MGDLYSWEESSLGAWDRWEREQRDDDLGFYGFVFLLAVLTLTVVALWVI